MCAAFFKGFRMAAVLSQEEMDNQKDGVERERDCWSIQGRRAGLATRIGEVLERHVGKAKRGSA